MAKYPLISGATGAEACLNLRADTVDNVFDVYTYMNTGDTDNAQRANLIVVIKNTAISGSGTELGIRGIAVKNLTSSTYPVYTTDTTGSTTITSGDNLDTPAEGWNLGPKYSSVPFIGSPESYADNSGDGNYVVSTISGLTPPTGAIGFLQIPSSGNITSSVVAHNTGLGTAGKVIPIYDPSYLTAQESPNDGTVFTNPIPDNSYAAFILAFQPTTAVSPNQANVLVIETNAGNITLNLSTESFNEIVMSGTVGSISGSSFTATGEMITDQSNWILGSNATGCYPSTKNAADLQTQVGNNVVLRVTDESSNLAGDWQWVNSYNQASTFLPGGENGSMTPVANSYANSGATNILGGLLGDCGEWVKVTGAETMSGDSLSGAGGNLWMAGYNTQALYKNFTFNGSTTYHTGTEYIAGGTQDNVNYAKNKFFIFKSLHLQYDTEDYSAADYGNQWYSFGLAFGVYARVTTSTGMPSTATELNLTTAATSSVSPRIETSITAGSDYFLQNGGEVSVVSDVRWNNFSNLNITTYNNKIASFTWADNLSNADGDAGTTYFRLKSNNGPNRVPKYTRATSGGADAEPTTFSTFDTISDTTDLYFNWMLKADITADTLYGDIENSRFFNKADSFEEAYGFHKIQYYSDENDLIWNNASDALYPGLLGGDLYYNLYVAPRLSYLSFVPKDNAVITVQGSGSIISADNDNFGDDFDCDINESAVSQWYNLDGSQFNNIPVVSTGVIGDDASQSPANSATPKVKFAGMDGAILKKGSGTTNQIFNTFTDTLSSTWSGDQLTVVANPNHRGLVDSAGNAISKFRPLDKIMDLGIAQLSVIDGNYYAYGSFRLWNNGDDIIYIHSLNTYNADICEIDVTDANNNNNSLANAGYKPNANTANDAVLYVCSNKDTGNPWGLSGNSETTGGLYTSKNYHDASTASDFYSATSNNMKTYYRANENQARYVSPQRKYVDLADDSNKFTLFTDATAGGFSVPSWDKIGGGGNGQTIFNGTQKYEGTIGSSEAEGQNPWGDVLYHVCMKIDPNTDLNDFGVYRKKLEIVSYTDDWANRKATTDGSTATNISDSARMELNVSNIYFKATVAAAPILKLEDTDGEEFASNTVVDLGTLNVG